MNKKTKSALSIAIKAEGTTRTLPSIAQQTGQVRGFMPEFTNLPARGGDAVCGLSRSFWYSAEREGLITLVRTRRPGQVRGRAVKLLEDPGQICECIVGAIALREGEADPEDLVTDGIATSEMIRALATVGAGQVSTHTPGVKRL